MIVRPGVAKELFEAMMPSWLSDIVDLDALNVESELSLSPELRKSFTDVTFSAPVEGMEEPAFLVLLIEHKSEPSSISPLAMENYRMAQMEAIAKKRGMRTKPLVIPYLLYHGAEPYEGPVRVSDTVKASKMMISYAFDRSFYLLDLTTTPDRVLLDKELAGVCLLVMKYGRNPIFQEAFHQVFQRLRAMVGKVDLAVIVRVIARYLWTVMEETAYNEASEIAIQYLNEELGGSVMLSAKEAFLQRGAAKGKTEIQEKNAIRMLRKGLPPQDVSEYLDMSLDRVVAIQSSMKA